MTKLFPSSSNVTPADSDPKDADEADEKERGLQEADAEIGRDLGEAMGVRMDALVGIDADFARAREEKGAPWREPLREQIARQFLAQFHLRRLS